ncbi:MAG: AMP-binding protein [Aromatoleum sp.]|jgi:O-succinylbenzoic acid--CoA ligase|uniref:AMP-binding protein n=1 Tax=Aromatoleum sp. TaxID=2307007 RepID=UPI0028959741|nr:AMP-binding protein [Aromatoleum sp.]MDT3671831.1 AMP-binding protein [Aromatoleum sp.]
MKRAELKQWVLTTGRAEEHGGILFLCDPGWSAAEKSQVAELQCRASEDGDGGNGETGWLCLPTGGTSGSIRFARHDEHTLSASLAGFCAHFGVAQVNALDVLPASHVSGLMARIRCAATGGEHVAWSWKQLEAGEWPELADKPDAWFISLVPTQLQRLLRSEAAVDRLRRFRAVFVGGGPFWPELAESAAAAGVPVVTAYGMTETGAMVVAQLPSDFAAGDRSCGRPMPHARVEIVDDVSGEVLPQGATGLVRITGDSLFHGYWPERRPTQSVLTDDLGCFDAQGRLTILGRRDAVIITGGKKVHPAEVEAALRSSGEFSDVAVVGVPDTDWGSVVVACHPRDAGTPDRRKVDSALAGLAAYKRPKKILGISPWPVNAVGKLNRAALLASASAGINH